MPAPRGRLQLSPPADDADVTPPRARWRILRPRTRTEVTLAVTAAGTVAGLVVAGLIYSSMYFDLLFSSGTERPMLSLVEKPMGRIVVPTDGSLCQEYTFDNDDGRIGSYRIRRCDDTPKADLKPALGASFNSFKQAFGKK